MDVLDAIMASDRSQLWLPLLRSVTAATDTWTVWKNADSALAGVGDIDAAATVCEWDDVEGEFVRWAGERRLGPAVSCRHIPGGRNLIAIPNQLEAFLELSIKHDKSYHGSPLFTVEQLAPLVEMDVRGFRRVRAGAEGVFKLVLNGAKWGGRCNRTGLERKQVVECLAADPAGVRLAAAQFGPASGAVIRLADAVVAGGWSTRNMLQIERAALVRAVRHPRTTGRRARFRLVGKATCPIVEGILSHGRRIPDDREQWLERVFRTHDHVWPTPETDAWSQSSSLKARRE